MKSQFNYLAIGINPELPCRELWLIADGKPQADLNAPICDRPTTTAYIDISRFKGMDLEIKVFPECNCRMEFTDTPPVNELYAAPDRPLVHFTPLCGQINDPNGLIFYEGKWHMFFQHYAPSPRVSRGNLWERNGWGHAVSADLMNWTHLPDAVCYGPEGAAWSGSAIEDADNVTGLKENEHNPLILFYTVHGGTTGVAKSVCHQNAAYSVDGGLTFRSLGEVVPNLDIPGLEHRPQGFSNRDPKVCRCAETGGFVMGLYLGDGGGYALLGSSDLLHWKEIQRINLEGDAECPDVFPLTASDGRKLWIFSGAGGYYAVGEMTEKGLVRIQPDSYIVGRRKSESNSYAAQTFSGTDRVRLAWMHMEYKKGSDYWGGMTFPVNLSLINEDGKYVLCELPVDFSGLIDESTRAEFSGAGEWTTAGGPCVLEAEAEAGAEFTLELFGVAFAFSGNGARVCLCGAPITAVDGKTRATIIFDRRSIEAYFGRGESGLTISEECDFSSPALRIRADKSAAVKVRYTKLKTCRFDVSDTL